MELKYYFDVFRRWALFIFLCIGVAGMGGFWYAQSRTQAYEASAQMLIGPSVSSPNPDLNALRTGAQLMQTYAELATTWPALQVVINELQLNTSVDQLKRNITLRTNEETQILTIRVQDPNPEQAIAITNSLTSVLMRLSPAGTGDPANTQYSSGAQHQSARRGYTNQIKLIEPAVHADPVVSSAKLIILLAGLAGCVLALTVVFVAEYFDDTLKLVEEPSHVFGLPVLGTIAGHKPLRGSGREVFAIEALPESQTARNYQMLGAKLFLTHSGQFPRAFVMSSPDRDHNTAEVAANLAIALVQSGSRVVLVDFDIHNPVIGAFFGVKADGNPTTLSSYHAEKLELINVAWLPNLSLFLPNVSSANSFAFVTSSVVQNLVTQLKTQADIVLIVAPSLQKFAESLMLASYTDGVLLTLNDARSRNRQVEQTIKTLQTLDIPIIGTVLSAGHHGSIRIFPVHHQRWMPAKKGPSQSSLDIPHP